MISYIIFKLGVILKTFCSSNWIWILKNSNRSITAQLTIKVFILIYQDNRKISTKTVSNPSFIFPLTDNPFSEGKTSKVSGERVGAGNFWSLLNCFKWFNLSRLNQCEAARRAPPSRRRTVSRSLHRMLMLAASSLQLYILLLSHAFSYTMYYYSLPQYGWHQECTFVCK